MFTSFLLNRGSRTIRSSCDSAKSAREQEGR
jgi:hypothetical protein